MSLRNASHDWHIVHRSVTASSFFFVQLYFEKGVGKKARDNPKCYCGFFEFNVLQRHLKE